MEQYKTVLEGGTGEIIEKKSRFIATVRPVRNEEETLAFLEEMRKQYWDARHNCYAYSVGGTENIQDAVMMENRQEPQGVRCLMLFWEKIFIMLRWS